MSLEMLYLFYFWIKIILIYYVFTKKSMQQENNENIKIPKNQENTNFDWVGSIDRADSV